MTITLSWLAAHSPYAPLITLGLLDLIERADPGRIPTVAWEPTGPHGAPRCVIAGADMGEAGEIVASADLPDLDKIPWRRRPGQSLRAYLDREADPLAEYLRLVSESPPLEARYLRTIASTCVRWLPNEKASDRRPFPVRSPLMAGVKADLAIPPRDTLPGLSPSALEVELTKGPSWRQSPMDNRTLGLVPGAAGETGNAYSTLLYLLLWHGLMVAGCFAIRHRATTRLPSTVVGGAFGLIRWSISPIPTPRSSLPWLFSLPDHHGESSGGFGAEEAADFADVVESLQVRRYASCSRPISKTVSRWSGGISTTLTDEELLDLGMRAVEEGTPVESYLLGKRKAPASI